MQSLLRDWLVRRHDYEHDEEIIHSEFVSANEIAAYIRPSGPTHVMNSGCISCIDVMIQVFVE